MTGWPKRHVASTAFSAQWSIDYTAKNCGRGGGGSAHGPVLMSLSPLLQLLRTEISVNRSAFLTLFFVCSFLNGYFLWCLLQSLSFRKKKTWQSGREWLGKARKLRPSAANQRDGTEHVTALPRNRALCLCGVMWLFPIFWLALQGRSFSRFPRYVGAGVHVVVVPPSCVCLRCQQLEREKKNNYLHHIVETSLVSAGVRVWLVLYVFFFFWILSWYGQNVFDITNLRCIGGGCLCGVTLDRTVV